MNKNNEAAESTPYVYCCDQHAKELTFDSMINEETFKLLGDKFESIGRMRPVRKFCSLKIVNIDENKNTKNEDRNRLQ